ncbi:hypothetical protein F5882DRAFT_431367 [Hyaloscypha sp. PMI_1271]|nr:hypothetical protein F5882DRAFT_431367 [Hyaloscypha sp. PMI_1271]
MDNPGQCKALNVSDEKRCLEAATSINGLFCSFHSKQCQDCDYGHAKFLEDLQSQKGTVVRALERLERRTAEVLFREEKWYSWVRECQDEEERGREKEREKVRMEAAMFKRHWKAAQLRARDAKAKEDKMRQDAYLEQVYKESLALKERNGEGEDTDDDEMDWDPIEDVLEDNRGSYLDLVQTFLWMVDPNAAAEADTAMSGINAPTPSTPGPSVLTETAESAPKLNAEISQGAKASPSSKKAKSKNKKKVTPAAKAPGPKPEPDKGLIESREEMHERLKNGTEYNQAKVKGVMIAGTLENPVISTKTVTFPENLVQKMLAEIHDIKHLLFCRLLLGHAALLPAALRANNVEEFLADPEVTTAALRDICLKMENPSLQDIRDACADFFRSEEEEEEADIEMSKPASPTSKDTDEHGMPMFKLKKQKGELPDTWKPKSEMAKMAEQMGQLPTFDSIMENEEGGAVNFGENKDSKVPRKKIRVKICGKSIWNYPSNKAMNRGGWLHFCIIAKDSSLHDAVALCRHWDEFFELNILAIWQYFPGANWAEWVGNRYRQQMLQLGFIMYFESASPDAHDLTIRENNRNRGGGRRSHAVFEARNFICAHIKRDDPMLFKAHRFRSGPDIYNPAGPVLKTICRDPETNRARDIQPGEDIMSIWDDVNHPGTTFFYSKDENHADQSEGNLSLRRVFDEPNKFPKNLFYHKADELEDAILFPEELADKKLDPLNVGKVDPIGIWEEGFSLKGFVEGDCFESDSDTESEAWMTDSDAGREHEDDSDLDDEADEEGDAVDADQETADAINDTEVEQKPKIDIVEVARAIGHSDEMREVMKKMLLKPKRAPRDRSSPAAMQAEFMEFLDKEKAKVFKQVWHSADLEPNAQAHYTEMMDMTRKCRKHCRNTFDCAPVILGFHLVDDLNVEPEYAKGVHKAIAKIAPFFYPQFLESEDGEPFRNSLMFNQAERAKNFPDIRSHVSNKYRAPSFWKEFEDEMRKVHGELNELPAEWDLHIRPIIAHLYKCGVLRSRSDLRVQGEAIAGKEPGRDKWDVFFDWRRNMNNMNWDPAMVNPLTINPFKATAKNFALKNPTARFAVLTLWSAPHFYPLMIGWDNRDPTSFRDLIGRYFNWMFVPKDLPRSEWSIHLSAQARITPYKKFLGKNVIARRDKYLVMATDEGELFKLVAATTFAIQTKPWRLELDLWKSFVNVDIKFLEGLDDKWVE